LGVEKQFKIFIKSKLELLQADEGANHSISAYIECIQEFCASKSQLLSTEWASFDQLLFDYVNFLFQVHYRLFNVFKLIETIRQNSTDAKLVAKQNKKILNYLYAIYTDAYDMNIRKNVENDESENQEPGAAAAERDIESQRWNDSFKDALARVNESMKALSIKN
jgi:hypothetical protein